MLKALEEKSEGRGGGVRCLKASEPEGLSELRLQRVLGHLFQV